MPKILVVDGDENVLRLLEIKIARAGFAVSTASDGEEGYIRARAGNVDLVVVGDALGPIDGHSLVRALASLPAPPLIVFLSPAGGEDDIARALRAGCQDYVLKPFSPHEVVHRIRVAVLRRAVARESST